MSNAKTLAITLLGIFIFAALYFGRPVPLLAQEKPGRKLTIKEKTLYETETRGEGLFLQRCSVCHLPRIMKFGSPGVMGPSLSGVFKKATPDEEKAYRQFILKGTADMPGFRYGLSPADLDDLVSFLKTL